VLGVHRFHEVEAAPWGVHLLSPQHVRGARGQAEAAVHTVVEELAETLVAVAGDRLGHGGLPARSGAQIPPVPRPGANRWSGSKASLTARINGRPGISPQRSTAVAGSGPVRTSWTVHPGCARASSITEATSSSGVPCGQDRWSAPRGAHPPTRTRRPSRAAASPA